MPASTCSAHDWLSPTPPVSMGVPAGLTRCQLGLPRQRDCHLVGTLMEVALLSHQSMVVAPKLYPRCKVSQPIEVEARGPPELLLYVRHVIHWAPFLDAQCLLLVQEELCEEFISQPYPLCLLIGGSVIHVVDLEHMLKVLFPSHAMVSGGQSCGIMGQSPCLTARLRRGTFRCCGWGNVWCCPRGEITLLLRRLHTHLLLHSPGVTGRLATVSPPPSPLSPMVLRALTTSGGSFINGGVESDSPPGRLAWQLYCFVSVVVVVL